MIKQEVMEQKVPTREQIDRLQDEVLKLPQVENVVTDHFFSGGMYCRRVWRPANTLVIGKVHKFDHFFMCVMGEIIAWSETGMRVLKPGDVIESKAGTKRVTYAMADSIGMTVHKTDKTDIEEIEDELVEFDPKAVYGPGNKLLDTALSDLQKVLKE
jgi:hypothetical protein